MMVVWRSFVRRDFISVMFLQKSMPLNYNLNTLGNKYLCWCFFFFMYSLVVFMHSSYCCPVQNIWIYISCNQFLSLGFVSCSALDCFEFVFFLFTTLYLVWLCSGV